jgi:hypothetical protein
MGARQSAAARPLDLDLPGDLYELLRREIKSIRGVNRVAVEE